jgi:hypothetical protein
MFSFGKKKEGQNSSKWSAGDETGMFHTMQDDISSFEGKGISPGAPESVEMPKPYLERPIERAIPEASQVSTGSGSPFLAANPNIKNQEAELKNIQKEEKNSKIVSQKEVETPDQYMTSALKTDKPKRVHSFPLGKMLFIISAILVAAGAFLWGYSLWIQRQDDIADKTVEIPPEPVKPAPKVEEPIVEEMPKWSNKFSTTTPNYWIIPIESMTADAMTKIISDKASEAKGLASGELAEFYVTDSKNNPVSFSAFSILAGIILPSQIYDSLEDSFSFYFYNDSDNIRTGISVKTKNSDKIVPIMSGAEKTLPANLKPLFLGLGNTGKAVEFSDSKYKDYSVRYYNINSTLNSVDYSITKSYLVIGTSLKTGRAILDKVQP